MENFINTLKIDWYYTQKAIEMLQGKWYWTAAILIVIACAIYVAVKKPLLLPLIAWGPLTSVVINNAIYLKLLKHMEELEYTQCTAFALVVGMIVGAGFIASAVDMRKPYREYSGAAEPPVRTLRATCPDVRSHHGFNSYRASLGSNP